METNNAILFTFGLIFLFLGFFSPIVNNEFDNSAPEINTDGIFDLSNEDISSGTSIQILSGLFFWVFNAPLWLNIILTLMRVLFWVIVYDKLPFTGA